MAWGRQRKAFAISGLAKKSAVQNCRKNHKISPKGSKYYSRRVFYDAASLFERC